MVAGTAGIGRNWHRLRFAHRRRSGCRWNPCTKCRRLTETKTASYSWNIRAAALADSKVRQRLGDIAYDVPPPDQQTPDTLAAFHKAEIEKWWPIIKAAGIKAE